MFHNPEARLPLGTRIFQNTPNTHSCMRGFQQYYSFKPSLSTFLLLLLSHFSRVTPQTSAHQALLPLGFSRQEHWSGVPFPSPMHESEKVKVKSLSRVRLLATPWTAASQAPPSVGFSRQEYWSGVPLLDNLLCLNSEVTVCWLLNEAQTIFPENFEVLLHCLLASIILM